MYPSRYYWTWLGRGMVVFYIVVSLGMIAKDEVAFSWILSVGLMSALATRP